MSGAGETQYAEEVKAEVRQTIRQLSEMSRSEATYDEFCQSVLDKIVKLTGSHGALLWQLNGQVPMVTHRAAGSKAEHITPVAKEHAELIVDVITSETSVCHPSSSLPSSQEASASGEALAYLMLFAPIFSRKKDCIGVVELLQRNDVTKSAQDGYLRFLSQIAQLFARWHEHRDLTVLSKNAEKWTDKLDFVTEVHRTIDSNETAFAIANEARRLLNCDRVSVARWNGSRCKVTAISSQDRFDNRANVVRKLGAVATASVASNTPFWIIGDTEGIAPEVASKINDYLDEAHSRTFIVLPLMQQAPREDDLEMKNRRKNKSKKLGALIIEFFDSDVLEDDIREDTKLITMQSELAMANSRQHSEIFMLPVWQRLGWIQQLLFRDHYAKTMTGLIALGTLILAMLILPSELKMKVDGVIQPQMRRNIFAEREGIIREVAVEERQDVNKGDLLLVLENNQLDMEITDLEGQLEVNDEQAKTIAMQLAKAVGATQEDMVALAGKRNQVEKQKEILERKLELKKKQRDSLRVYSPIDGTIMTWDIEGRLLNLPVQPNQLIMSVANRDGVWELEVRIPQNKIGYVTKAMSESDEPLEVDFIVGTNANQRVTGKLRSIADRAEMSDAGEQEYRAIIDVDGDIEKLLGVRPGAGVTAKIKCGTHRMGFVWFHQIWDFLSTRVFF